MIIPLRGRFLREYVRGFVKLTGRRERTDESTTYYKLVDLSIVYIFFPFKCK